MKKRIERVRIGAIIALDRRAFSGIQLFVAAKLRKLWILFAASALLAESPAAPPRPVVLEKLPLGAAERANLQASIEKHDYAAAEELLAAAAKREPKSQSILLVLGDILFLDGKHLNAAVVLKKAEAVAPLDERSRFLLALCYIAMGRSSWARPELERLAQANQSNAVYPYWLSRIAYRQTDIRAALQQAQKAVRVDPAFMKAYDQLGLCYEALDDFQSAIQAFRQAIQLNGKLPEPSPWPPMNLGVLLLRMERLEEADAQLRESVRIQPDFPVAHYRLGQVLEKEDRYQEAIAELERAAELDPTYPEPHYALARLYKRQKDSRAAAEFSAFQNLRKQDKLKGITRPD
jgi:tetratricopeptide (TPR) repeat protein